ncbi:hypothetical protein F5B22DRAFT_647428 [Xylaria bambusicola]|uniref:uncharacterized protein n=1 Tax=Xylaria bambusicola TaxID=326684 RepID=UPI002007AB2F|nr:uncharacterized protein F5B22DRAFT_647428 [Xylaria bambusicola]KAI0514671.1 hypothetical protein F5B22DRAFT_647428 [Xylaria bambusicola]
MLPIKTAAPIRKRKAHRKSRNGCANCKLRGIKCDETKPCCRRCDAFNVVCCYGSKFSPESLSAKPSFRVHIGAAPQAVVQSPPAPLPISGSRHSLEIYQLLARDIPLIEKFQKRTAWTLGTRATHHVYAEKVLPLAFTNPLLMHTVLAMAEMHDLAMEPFGTRRSYSLTYHWYHAVSSMRQYLNRPFAPSDGDVLWISANLISISHLAYVEERYPEEAWPLRSPSPADLLWFTLCDGQKVVAELTNPTRDNAPFYLPARSEERSTAKWLPKEFEAFFEVLNSRRTDEGNFSNREDIDEEGIGRIHGVRINPYHKAVKIAVELFERELDHENILAHVCFFRALDAPFRELLIRKDEKAMLVLLYWYAKICDRRIWWLWKQSCTEGVAICRYLERAWTISGDEVGLRLLELPRMRLMTASGVAG